MHTLYIVKRLSEEDNILLAENTVLALKDTRGNIFTLGMLQDFSVDLDTDKLFWRANISVALKDIHTISPEEFKKLTSEEEKDNV